MGMFGNVKLFVYYELNKEDLYIIFDFGVDEDDEECEDL